MVIHTIIVGINKGNHPPNRSIRDRGMYTLIRLEKIINCNKVGVNVNFNLFITSLNYIHKW